MDKPAPAFLFSMDELPESVAVYKLKQANGRNTPEVTKRVICQLAGQGASYREIQEIVGVSPALITAVLRENAPKVEAIRATHSIKRKQVAGVFLDLMLEKATDPEATKKEGLSGIAMAYKLIQDADSVADGLPTEIVRVEGGLTLEGFQEWVSTAEKSVVVREVQEAEISLPEGLAYDNKSPDLAVEPVESQGVAVRDTVFDTESHPETTSVMPCPPGGGGAAASDPTES